MERLSKSQIRATIVFGFVLSVIGTVIIFVDNVEALGYQFSFHGLIDQLVSPLATITAVFAWFTLTRLEARDGAQLNVLRLAYLFFGIQYLITAVGYNFIFTPPHSFGGFWTTASIWLYFIGALTSAVGFFLMSRPTVISAVDQLDVA